MTYAPPSRDLGGWVLRIDGPAYGEHVQAVSVGLTGWDACGPVLEMRFYPTLTWDGQAVDDFSSAVVGGRYGYTGSGFWYRFEVPGPPGATAVLSYHPVTGGKLRQGDGLSTDTLFGRLEVHWPGAVSPDLYQVRGARLDVGLLRTPDLASQDTDRQDSLPAILLGLDDTPATDRDFIARMKARGLYGEIAVITGLVGVRDRPTWAELEQWRADGFAVVAHSRRHGKWTGPGAEFMHEVVSSLKAVRDHGLDDGVFVQPGVWTGSIDFNTPGKVQSWRGALLRTFASVSETYIGTPTVRLPLSAPSRTQLSHITASDGMPNQGILAAWQKALQPGAFTVFMVHTYRLAAPGQLDWFLDSLATARATGRIRLLRSSEDVF